MTLDGSHLSDGSVCNSKAMYLAALATKYYQGSNWGIRKGKLTRMNEVMPFPTVVTSFNKPTALNIKVLLCIAIGKYWSTVFQLGWEKGRVQKKLGTI